MPGNCHCDELGEILFSGYAGYRSSPHGPHPTEISSTTSIKPLASISSLNDCMKSRYDSSGVRPSSVLALSAQSEMHSGFR